VKLALNVSIIQMMLIVSSPAASSEVHNEKSRNLNFRATIVWWTFPVG